MTQCKYTFVTKFKVTFCTLVTKCIRGGIMGDFNKQKYDNEYAKQNYDRCIFNVPKGRKAII